MAKGSEHLVRFELRLDFHATTESCHSLAGLRAQDRLSSILETCNLLLGERLNAFVLCHLKFAKVMVFPRDCVAVHIQAALFLSHDPNA